MCIGVVGVCVYPQPGVCVTSARCVCVCPPNTNESGQVSVCLTTGVVAVYFSCVPEGEVLSSHRYSGGKEKQVARFSTQTRNKLS